MAPVSIPPEQKEFLTVTGTGTLLLTQPQRVAQSLSVSIEKVRLFPTPEYYNFRQPEPESFWGYLQLVQRDFVQELIQLSYRRQSILNSSRYELEPIEQLRCLIKDSTLTLFDAIGTIYLAGGGDANALGVERANYILRNAQPRLIPAVPTTAIYYEIAPGWAGLISIIWTGYAEPCAQLETPQILPSPRSPGKDESGPGNNDGGGTRPTTPPPPDRSSDPDSDNAGPPPDSPAGPPTPTVIPPDQPQGNYTITVQFIRGFRPSPGGPCNAIVDTTTRQLLNNSGPGSVTNTSTNPSSLSYSIIDKDGQIVAFITSGNSDPNGCPPQIVSVTNTPI